jgi:TRAP-type C4-dicarboxylate transport system permease large subunit
VIKNFISNIYPKILETILSIFNIKSDIIVGLWSIVILIGCVFSILKTHEVSAPVASIFSVVISAFAGHKMVKVWKGPDSDGQGDLNGKDQGTSK